MTGKTTKIDLVENTNINYSSDSQWNKPFTCHN